jgi:hypothetical protein
MTGTSGEDAQPDATPLPAVPLTPKRGAFPTPESELAKAKPYVPSDHETPETSGEPAPREGREQ